jgi:pimeloyl-ACP methyl ester carboxylesterase
LIATALTESGYITLTFDGADCLRGPDASFPNATTSGFVEDAEDVIAYMKEAPWCKGPFVLAGHSLGALVATRLEHLHPGTSTKLLLVAPAICWYKDRSGKFLKRIHFLARQVHAMRKKGVLMPIYPKWILDYISYDIRKDAAHCACPTFIISAGDDLTVARAVAHEKLATLFPNARHTTIAGATHTFAGNEQELTQSIQEWLS